MKRQALQNKQVGVLRMAFRVRKVFGTFEKRAPEYGTSKLNSRMTAGPGKCNLLQATFFHSNEAIA